MEKVPEHKNIVRSADVLGANVINQTKENLGKIYEIVLDKLSGQVHYAVLESGAVLGLGGKLFAIPWISLKYDPVEKAFVVNLTKDELERSAGFDKENWPETSSHVWEDSIMELYDLAGN